MNNPSFIEKYAASIASIASILFLIAILSYFVPRIFMNIGFTLDYQVWGAFGDFIGGVLNPLISIIVILILVFDLKFTRNEFIKSIKAQQKSQQAITAQVDIITPKPRVTYHLINLNRGYYLVIKNIGTDIAYSVNVTTDQELGITNPKIIDRKYPSLIPQQELRIRVGTSTNEGPKGILPHTATIKYDHKDSKYNEVKSSVDTFEINDALIEDC